MKNRLQIISPKNKTFFLLTDIISGSTLESLSTGKFGDKIGKERRLGIVSLTSRICSFIDTRGIVILLTCPMVDFEDKIAVLNFVGIDGGCGGGKEIVIVVGLGVVIGVIIGVGITGGSGVGGGIVVGLGVEIGVRIGVGITGGSAGSIAIEVGIAVSNGVG